MFLNPWIPCIPCDLIKSYFVELIFSGDMPVFALPLGTYNVPPSRP